MIDKSIRDVLKDIMEQYGREVFYDSRRVNALLKDLAPKLDRERKLIHSALNENIHIRLLRCISSTKEEQKIVIKKSIEDLVSDAWISEAGASYAIYSLAYALGFIDVLYDEDKQKEELTDSVKKRELKKGKHMIDNLDFFHELENYDKIGYKAFSGNFLLQNIVIPDSVKIIGKKAFFGCIYLKSISLPKTIEKIGVLLFEGCVSLEKISVHPENVYFGSSEQVLFHKHSKSLIRYANQSRVEYKIPEGIVCVEKKAFEFITLEKLYLPSSLEDLSHYSFFVCEKLHDIIVDSKNKVYCDIDGVLHTKEKDTLLIYPMGRNLVWYIVEDVVKTIGEASFSHAEYLQSITISGSVERIGARAFEYCVMLRTITLPNSVIEIGDYAFLHCLRLESVMLPRSIVSIGECAFEYCIELERIHIPSKVRRIGNLAFRNCYKLISIVIPESVEFIGDGALEGCSNRLVVRLRKGSYAETYCRVRNISVEYVL